jgi:hypothetical protein
MAPIARRHGAVRALTLLTVSSAPSRDPNSSEKQ